MQAPADEIALAWQPGLFTGSFEIIAATNPPVAGKLRAQNGDTIQVRFVDPVASITLSATAVVDTVPPVISGVTPDPDYQQAFIYWDTSEVTDALVQFGESPGFLNRSAYDATPGTFQAVTLPGLAPNRVYYYRVVSRDLAGNATTDNNQGNLYTFRTLLPLLPPWSDNFNSGAPGWSLYTIEGSQSEWFLGVPNSGEGSEAHQRAGHQRPALEHPRLERHGEVAVDDDLERLARALDQAHAELRMVLPHRADAREHRAGTRAPAVAVPARRLAGDPAARPVGQRGAPVEAGREP